MCVFYLYIWTEIQQKFVYKCLMYILLCHEIKRNVNTFIESHGLRFETVLDKKTE